MNRNRIILKANLTRMRMQPTSRRLYKSQRRLSLWTAHNSNEPMDAEAPTTAEESDAASSPARKSQRQESRPR